MTPKSRKSLREAFGSLDWDALGTRPAMISLTYPGGDWRAVVPDAATLQRHFRAFRKRWERQWGEPMRGLWVREFQTRGAPHLHVYAGLPEAMSDAEFEKLQEKRRVGVALEEELGKYAARSANPIWIRHCGDVCRWMLTEWSEVCGTTADRHHPKRGVDVAPIFFVPGAEGPSRWTTWGRVGEYVWRESAKKTQKQLPAGWAPAGRAWGKFGVGYVAERRYEAPFVAMEIRRAELLYLLRARGVRLKPRGVDGLTLYPPPNWNDKKFAEWAPAFAARVEKWAHEEAAWKYFGDFPEGAPRRRGLPHHALGGKRYSGRGGRRRAERRALREDEALMARVAELEEAEEERMEMYEEMAREREEQERVEGEASA